MATAELKSKIQAELAELTEVQPSSRRDETITTQGYLQRLAQATASLDDADWGKLSPAAQTWYNQAADAVEAKKDIPDFPDLPKAEEPASSRRRSSKSDDAPAAKREAKVGDEVKITTKRGKVYEGKLVEIDEKDNLYIVETDDNPKGEELNRDRCESIEVVGGASSGSAGKTTKPYTVEDAREGDHVKIVNKRGKEYAGRITETTDKDIVLVLDDGEIEEVLKDRVETIELTGGGDHVDSTTSGGRGSKKEETKAEEAPARGRRGSSSTKAEDAGEKGKPVTLRLRELICENPDAKKEEVAKLGRKEGLEFKDGTFDIAWNDTTKILGILRGIGWKAPAGR